MITPAYVRTMADYNRWQNRSLYGAADGLSDEVRKQQRGAFFGSIHGTLNHLLFGDQIWMSRFAGTPKPKAAGIPDSVGMYERWEDLKRERAAFDEVIIGWAEKLDPKWLEGDLTWYSGAAKRDVTKPKGAAGHPHVQPPDAPPRPGALHAHAVRGEARRYRFAVPADLSGSARKALGSDRLAHAFAIQTDGVPKGSDPIPPPARGRTRLAWGRSRIRGRLP